MWRRFGLIVLIFSFVGRVKAQGLSADLRHLSAEQFPLITLDFTLRDSVGQGITTPNQLQLWENEQPITDFTWSAVPLGLDLTILIDANRELLHVDLIDGPSRWQHVQQWITQFAQDEMSHIGLDTVTLIVADGEELRLLLDHESRPAIVAEAVANYQPQQLPRVAPVQEMLLEALRQSADPRQRYQAILFFSDTEKLDAQLDFEELVPLAERSPATFFSIILGKIASDREKEMMGQLTQPTGGGIIHLPTAEKGYPLLATLTSNRDYLRLTYHSTLNTPQQVQVRVSADSATLEGEYPLQIQPPTLTTLPTTPLVRQNNGGELRTFEPTRTLVGVKVTWPDGLPRSLRQVRFWADGREQQLKQPAILDTTGLLTLFWEVTLLDSADYHLKIAVTDELGLAAQTEWRQPLLVVTPTTTPLLSSIATPLPATPFAPLEVRPMPSPDQLQSWITYLLVAMIIMAPFVLIWKIRQRRQKRAVTTPAVVAPPVRPKVVLPQHVYLIWRREGEDRPIYLPIVKITSKIGSDPLRASIVLDHPSVSRHHATLRYEGNRFIIQDEASDYGTRVNFQPLGIKAHILLDGDEIEFGSTIAQFRIFSSESTSLPPSSDGNGEES